MEVSRITAVVTANTAGFMRGMAQVDAATKRTAAQMNGMTTAVSRASTRMTSIGSVLTKRLSLPMLAIGGASVAMAASFETSMAKIQGLVGVAGKDVEKLAADAQRIGPAYGKSANEAAEALFYITSAGIDASEAASVLEASAKASAVGLGDTATVADLATSAMNAYGSSVLPAAGATDVMVKAVKLGKLQSEELAGSMGRVLPVASAMGVSFDQVGAAFAALSRTGTNAAEAATQIRGILASILRPTRMAQETLAEYGTSAGELRKQVREKGLLSVLQTLTKTFGDNEEAQARVFGNIRALSGVMDLMGKNTKTTQKIFDEMSDSTGALDDAFAVTEQTSAFKMAKAMESIKTALLGVGSAIAPVIGMIADGFTKIGSVLSALPGPVKQFTAALIGLAAVAGPTMLIMGKLGGAFTKVGAASAAAGAASAGAAGKVGLLARALPLMTNPIGAATVAVGAGIAALFAFRNQLSHGERAIKAMTERQQAFKDSVSAVGAAFTASGQGVRSATEARNKQAEAAKKATEAEDAYLRAANNGRKANETQAQFLERLAKLRRDATEAQAAQTQAGAMSNAAVRNSVDALSKLEQAGKDELETARERAEQSRKQIQAHALYGKTEAQRTKLINEAEMAQADLAVVESRQVSRLKDLENNYKSNIKPVKQSNLSDAEKSATIDSLNRRLSRTRSRIKDLQGGKGKATVKVKEEVEQAEILAAKRLLEGLNNKVFKVTLKAMKQGFSFGGFAQGFASGGTVRGPGGVDKIPAMLTAGEAVLTKKQQAMVNSGMTIEDAFRATGAIGFAKGGTTDKKEAAKKRRERVSKAGRGLIDAMRDQLTDRITAKFSGGFTGKGATGFTLGLIEELRRKQEQNLKNIEASFDMAGLQTTMQNAMNALSKTHRTAMREFDKTNEASLQVFQTNAENAIEAINEKFEGQRKVIQETYDALTPAEEALKSLNEQAEATNLASGIADAQKALEEARKFGSASQIKDAQKALDDALLAQQRADLQKQAEEQRKQKEDAREQALSDLEDAQEAELKASREHHAGLIAAERERIEIAREALSESQAAEVASTQAHYNALAAQKQAQIDAALQRQRDADAQEMAMLQHQQEQEKAALDRRLNKMGQHFDRAADIGVKGTRKAVNQLNWFRNQFERSGHILIGSFARGMSKQSPAIAKAARQISSILRDYLKLNSPADKGPLSTLDHWFDALGPTLMSGADFTEVERGLNGISAGGGNRARSGSTVTINLNVSDQTFAGMSRDQADRVAREIQAAIDRQVRFTI